jgi:hypothetical protein
VGEEHMGKQDKFEMMLHYIIAKCGDRPNVGTKVLCKLCYFSDFDHYERNFESITGHNYKKVLHGPIPVEYETYFILLESKDQVKKKSTMKGSYRQERYQSKTTPDLSGFNAEELASIDSAIERYGNMNGKEIEEISHKDIPWMVTKDGEIIDYGTVMYRDACTSVVVLHPVSGEGE